MQWFANVQQQQRSRLIALAPSSRRRPQSLYSRRGHRNGWWCKCDSDFSIKHKKERNLFGGQCFLLTYSGSGGNVGLLSTSAIDEEGKLWSPSVNLEGSLK